MHHEKSGVKKFQLGSGKCVASEDAAAA